MVESGGNTAYIGITNYAQLAMGILFLLSCRMLMLHLMQVI